VAYTRRIVVVCGYGCNLDSPLRPYLDRVAKYCARVRPEYIILCGGQTQQKSFPGRSEADVMYDYLYKRLDSAPNFHPGWFTEDESFTTYENIRDAAAVIRRLEAAEESHEGWSRPPAVTIFCEATRALKVAMLARHFIGFPPSAGGAPIRIETDSWELMHPTLELVGTLKEWLAIRFPFFNDIQSRTRRRKSLTR
jgi:hypothetical protein